MNFSTDSRLISAAIVLGFLGYESTARAELVFLAKRVSMRIALHANVVAMPNSWHDANLADASSRLQSDSGVDDLAVNLTLERMGSQMTFSGGGSTDVINNQSQYTATINNSSKAWINVVNQINWCGQTGNWIGCAEYTKPLLVTRGGAISNVGPVLYAHEFGHTRGLVHNGVPNQIMNPVAALQNNKVWAQFHLIQFRDPVSFNCNSGTAGAPRLCVLETEWVNLPSVAAGSVAATQAGSVPRIEELAQSAFVGFGVI